MQKLPQISHYTLEHKNSHRIHRSAQMLIALFSHRIHRTHRTFCYKNLCKSVKSVGDYLSGCMGMARMPYPPTIPSYNTSVGRERL